MTAAVAYTDVSTNAARYVRYPLRIDAPDGEAYGNIYDACLRYGKSVAAVRAEAPNAEVAVAH